MARQTNANLRNQKEVKGLLPDQWDEKNIRTLIAMWCKIHPRGQYNWTTDEKDERKIFIEYLNPYDHVEYMRKVMKKERKMNSILVKGKSDPTWIRLSLPPAFAAELRKAYPTLLTDRRQTDWFLHKFPEFKLGD